jgi:hypothetical protein
MFHFGRVGIATRKLVVALAIFMAAASLYGCASSDPDEASAGATPCQGIDQQACEASDNARQLRDAADYQGEPELGYVKSPPGMLPMPLTSRNSPLN